MCGSRGWCLYLSFGFDFRTDEASFNWYRPGKVYGRCQKIWIGYWSSKNKCAVVFANSSAFLGDQSRGLNSSFSFCGRRRFIQNFIHGFKFGGVRYLLYIHVKLLTDSRIWFQHCFNTHFLPWTPRTKVKRISIEFSVARGKNNVSGIQGKVPSVIKFPVNIYVIIGSLF